MFSEELLDDTFGRSLEKGCPGQKIQFLAMQAILFYVYDSIPLFHLVADFGQGSKDICSNFLANDFITFRSSLVFELIQCESTVSDASMQSLLSYYRGVELDHYKYVNKWK